MALALSQFLEYTVVTSLSAYCDKEYVIPTTKEAMVTSGREASILSKLACNKKFAVGNSETIPCKAKQFPRVEIFRALPKEKKFRFSFYCNPESKNSKRQRHFLLLTLVHSNTESPSGSFV